MKVEIESQGISYTLKRRSFVGRLIRSPYVLVQHYRILRKCNDRFTSMWCSLDFVLMLLRAKW